MNISNETNRCNEILNKINQQKEQEMAEERPLIIDLVEASKQVLLDSAERKVAEYGKFSPVAIQYEIPETNNLGILSISYDDEDPSTQRFLTIGVHHRNGDRVASNFLMRGTKAEILEYLNSNENTNELVDITKKLSQETDEFYSSL